MFRQYTCTYSTELQHTHCRPRAAVTSIVSTIYYNILVYSRTITSCVIVIIWCETWSPLNVCGSGVWTGILFGKKNNIAYGVITGNSLFCFCFLIFIFIFYESNMILCCVVPVILIFRRIPKIQRRRIGPRLLQP